LSEVVPFLQEDVSTIQAAIHSSEIQNRCRKSRTEDGARLIQDITLYPLQTESYRGAVIRIDDITDKVLLEAKVHQNEKMDAVGQLAGGIAHDFNNMLSGIIGATELLRDYLPDDAQSHNLHNMILSTADRAADLTEKLLSFSRQQPLESTNINVHTLLNDTISLLKNTVDRRIEINTSLEAEQSCVIASISQIQSTFLNIGINASHAMPERGVLDISTRVVELDEVYCSTSPFNITSGSFIEIEFRDTGTGIAKENIDRIFEPFFTTKDQGKGTGLGLAAVFGTVKQYNGAVDVYSEVGVGTSFHILLPLVISDVVLEKSESQKISGSGNVLVVDDEPIVRATAKAILESLGYAVTLAENGREGIDTFCDSTNQFDLVILDMIMPEMNGRECFEEIIKVEPTAKIVISSGFTRDEDIDTMKENGLSGFIRKPYRTAELSQLVNDVLN